MKQVNMTSLGDDARETFTIAGLEKAKERALEQHLRVRAPQTWTVLCASVDQGLRTIVDSGSQPTQNGNWCRDVNVCLLWQIWTRESEVSIPQCEVQQLWQVRTSEHADNVRNLLASQVPRAAVARVLAKAARAVETQASAIVVDRSVIDLIALVDTNVAASVASVVI